MDEQTLLISLDADGSLGGSPAFCLQHIWKPQRYTRLKGQSQNEQVTPSENQKMYENVILPGNVQNQVGDGCLSRTILIIVKKKRLDQIPKVCCMKVNILQRDPKITTKAGPFWKIQVPKPG